MCALLVQGGPSVPTRVGYRTRVTLEQKPLPAGLTCVSSDVTTREGKRNSLPKASTTVRAYEKELLTRVEPELAYFTWGS